MFAFVDRAYSYRLADLANRDGHEMYQVTRDVEIPKGYDEDTYLRDTALVNDGVVITTDRGQFEDFARQQVAKNASHVFAAPCIRIPNVKSRQGVSTPKEQYALLKQALPKIQHLLRPGAFIELRPGAEPKIVVAPLTRQREADLRRAEARKDRQNAARREWKPPPPPGRAPGQGR